VGHLAEAGVRRGSGTGTGRGTGTETSGAKRACVLRVGGTNCDREVQIALEEVGIAADVLHMKQLGKARSISDYHMLVIPGGFSYGDYVRAGAIWGKEMMIGLRRELEMFVGDGKLVLGICNGFQVLVESGILPGNGFSDVPTAALANNDSAKYECRWTCLKVEESRTPFTKSIAPGTILRIPIGHGEGNFQVPSDDALKGLLENGQVVFRYATVQGKAANGIYPHNPNGSVYDIAAVCNKEGNVMGMMPHPERAFFGWQLPKATGAEYGDGRLIFKNAADYLQQF